MKTPVPLYVLIARALDAYRRSKTEKASHKLVIETYQARLPPGVTVDLQICKTKYAGEQFVLLGPYFRASVTPSLILGIRVNVSGDMSPAVRERLADTLYSALVRSE